LTSAFGTSRTSCNARIARSHPPPPAVTRIGRMDTADPTPTVQRLTAADAQAYRTLMLPAYAGHPEAFTSTAEERAALPLAWWQHRLSDDTVIGARDAQGALVGAVALTTERRARTRHKAALVGMYVQPSQRGRGLGRRLVQAVLAEAARQPALRLVQLTVTDGNHAALALYQGCGFQVFGREPMAVADGDGYLTKLHLWCPLPAAG
jgi:RimJ/RimL family protein N-acetyltransferase